MGIQRIILSGRASRLGGWTSFIRSGKWWPILWLDFQFCGQVHMKTVNQCSLVRWLRLGLPSWTCLAQQAALILALLLLWPFVGFIGSQPNLSCIVIYLSVAYFGILWARISKVRRLTWTDRIVAGPKQHSKTQQETITVPIPDCATIFHEPHHITAYRYCFPKSRGRILN